ncbi:hypothetical protein ACOBQX_25400 [Actinokineospora sp. G85]
MNTMWVSFTATVPDWAVADLNRHVAAYSAQASASEVAAGVVAEAGRR